MSTPSPALPQRDPTPLRPDDAVQHVVALPLPRTSLVGREREIATVRAMLDAVDVPLVTITGPGGVGKTRIALGVGAAVVANNDRDVIFVPLADVRSAGQVVPAIARAVGIPSSDEASSSDSLSTALRHRPTLLVLDNLEQVLDVAPQLAAILVACPALTILATSRAPLRITGEHVYPLPSLALAPRGIVPGTLDKIASAEAVALFTVRAQEVDPSFTLTTNNAPVVADICHRLDGLPLAIELAASRIPVLSPQAILARLDHRFTLLAGGATDQPPRLRSLQDAIAWSYDLLDDGEQVLLRRLAVFMGGCTLDDAEAICGEPGMDVLEGITTLIRHSLVQRTGSADDPPRYRMLETVREFAMEQLDASEDAPVIRERHARHFKARVEEARVGYHSPADPDPTHLRFDIEWPNVNVAMAWEAAHGHAELLLRVMEVGWWAWIPAEAVGWIDRAIAGDASIPTGQRPLLLATAAEYALLRGDLAQARALIEQCRAVAQEGVDLKALALAAQTQGRIAEKIGDFTAAEAHCRSALARWQELDEPSWRILDATWWLGMAILDRGDPIQAEELVAQALTMALATNASWTVPQLHEALANCADQQGDTLRAAHLLTGSLAAIRDGWPGVAGIRTNAFFLLTAARCLNRLGAMAATIDDADLAVRLVAAASMLFERSGTPLTASDQEMIDRTLAAARVRLTETGFAAAWSAGAALSPEAACNEGLAVAERVIATSQVRPGIPGGLSRRERDVLVELASGASNRIIAERLSISERTVETHVLHILTKLGLESRTAAATWAVRHDLA